MDFHIVESFEDLQALPEATRISVYRMVASEIVITGTAYENPQADAIINEATEKVQVFINDFVGRNIRLSKSFMGEYKNHVAMTLLLNLEFLDLMSKN